VYIPSTRFNLNESSSETETFGQTHSQIGMEFAVCIASFFLNSRRGMK